MVKWEIRVNLLYQLTKNNFMQTEKTHFETDNFLFQGIQPTPFNISFYYNDKKITVKLKNGEDILKIANLIHLLLIPYGIETEVINGECNSSIIDILTK